MTEEEHKARAMLLGGMWGRRSNCYRIPPKPGGWSSTYYDADTMEELTYEQWETRVDIGMRRL